MSNPTKADLLENLAEHEELLNKAEKELDFLIFSWHPDRRHEPLAANEVVRELARLRDILGGGE